MHISHPRILFFRIFYSTTFTILTLVLAALVLITPSDHIYQSFRAHELYHIIVVAAVYILTFLITIFIYAGRLYATRSALAAIPREWSPGDKGDVGVSVRAVVKESLERSAVIAYEARPKDAKDDKAIKSVARRKPWLRTSKDAGLSTSEPIWGTISHPGWSSPSSPDLPNLNYEPVILELSNLIEAKAVSLAPSHPLYASDSPVESPETFIPDAIAIEVLQRPAAMGLRDYMAHLTKLGMVNPPNLGGKFLSLYERARFSGEALREEEFRDLMSVFAEILRNMQTLDESIVESLHAAAEGIAIESSSGSSIDSRSLSSNATVAHTPQPDAFDSSTTTSAASHARTRSIISQREQPPGATATQNSKTPSYRSLHQVQSNTSSRPSMAGSVIRLAEARSSLDLPYAFVTSDEERVL